MCHAEKPPWSWTPLKSFRRGHDMHTELELFLLIFPAESWSSPGFFLAIKALKVSNETAMIQQSKRQLASSCWNSCHLMSQSVADVHDKHETVGTVGTAEIDKCKSLWKLTKTLGASQFQTDNDCTWSLSLGIGRSWAKMFLTDCKRRTIVELNWLEFS